MTGFKIRSVYLLAVLLFSTISTALWDGDCRLDWSRGVLRCIKEIPCAERFTYVREESWGWWTHPRYGREYRCNYITVCKPEFVEVDIPVNNYVPYPRPCRPPPISNHCRPPPPPPHPTFTHDWWHFPCSHPHPNPCPHPHPHPCPNPHPHPHPCPHPPKPTCTKPTFTRPTCTKPTFTKPTYTKPTCTKPTFTKPTWTIPSLTKSSITITSESFTYSSTNTHTFSLDISSSKIYPSSEAYSSSELITSSSEAYSSSALITSSSEAYSNSELITSSSEAYSNSELITSSSEAYSSSELITSSSEAYSNSELITSSSESFSSIETTSKDTTSYGETSSRSFILSTPEPIHRTSTTTTYWTGSYETTFSTITKTSTGTDNFVTTETIYIVETPIRALLSTTSNYWFSSHFTTTTLYTTTFTGSDNFETTETVYEVFIPIYESTTTIYTDFPDPILLIQQTNYPVYYTTSTMIEIENELDCILEMIYVYLGSELGSFNGTINFDEVLEVGKN
ncbi:hypothetical protein Kpol_400p11 [Vanderwaltozyma polyspora DSM 70294]|uniref:Flo11 domain-containing protein n=1 Tax=Vanderwaltozyma polyspora (strain ATCC 22028 / DSM 70294 / BCRC 21397 / CBS 2163 / NBRC 10782 / NRRL Y-8283 / UCD 57-17) TaxID=436907 RepID=A7TRV0_VANPO|nr:uncharacterized protein Kpol_400p11 [Vanderwaltozyma polyspora DSM 70294]EDO15017.1 hypothetical protein Kpol_400p11 [Vanderwaltozyma polyspora DSM 70294]